MTDSITWVRVALDAETAEQIDSEAALEGLGPTLAERLDNLVAQGCTRIGLVGLTLSAGPTSLSWLRRAAAFWLAAHDSTSVQLWLAREPVRAAGALPSLSRPERIQAGETGMTSPSWQELTPHRYHVLACQGTRCRARGAAATLAALQAALREHGAADHSVLLTRTLCMYPCNRGPLVVVYPDDAWFEAVSPAQARRLVEDLCRPRG